MSINFIEFTGRAQTAAHDDVRITKSGTDLRLGTRLSCFRFLARRQENRETSRAFVESIKNHPQYCHMLSAVADITRGLENSSKPLTARTINTVATSLAMARVELLEANDYAATDLRNRVGIPMNTVLALKDYCNEHGINMASMDPMEAFSLNFIQDSLKSEFAQIVPGVGPSLRMGILKTPFVVDTLKAIFQGDISALDDLPRNLFAGTRITMVPCLNVMDYMGPDCAFLDDKDMQKAASFLAENFKRGIVPPADVKATVRHMTHLNTGMGIKLPGATLATTGGCEKALISAMAHNAISASMEHTLTAQGLPPHLAESLAHHPTVTANASLALEDLDFQSATLVEDIAQILRQTTEAFVAKNKDELTNIVKQFTEQNIAQETQASIINTVLGFKGLMGSVLVEGAELTPEAFTEKLKSFTQNALLSSHGVPLNPKETQEKLQHVMDFFLAQTGVSKADAFKRIHDQYAQLMQNMSAIMRNGSYFKSNRAMQEDFTAQYNVLHMLAETAQPYVSGSPEAANNPVFESKTQEDIFQELTDEIVAPEAGSPSHVQVGNKQLDPLTIALGQNFTTGSYNMAPSLFGSKAHHNHENYHAVMQPYFENMISDNPTSSAAPNARLTAFLNDHKADCGLTDRDGLTVDIAKISMNTLFKAARTAYNDYASDTKRIVTPAEGARVIEQAMTEALTAMGQTMKELSQNPHIAPKDKQVMLDMALATELRTASALDCAYTTSFNRPFVGYPSLMDKFTTLMESHLALDETLIPFIFETFGPSISDMPSTLRGLEGFGKDEGLKELASGLGHLIANSDAFNREQRTALFNALNAETTRLTVEGICDGMNGQLMEIYPKVNNIEFVRIAKKWENNDKLLECLTALRDQLARRLAKDANAPMSEAEPEAHIVSHFRFPKELCSGAVLRACTYGLGTVTKHIHTPLDCLLADKKPRPSEGVFTAAGKVLSKLPGARDNVFMLNLIAHHADKIAIASDNGNKDLSPRQIYTLLTDKKAPFSLPKNELTSKVYTAVLNDFRPAVRVLSPYTKRAEALHIDIVTTALKKGISAQTMNAVLKGERLTLDSVAPQALTMQGLENYNESNAYGLMTEHPQKHPDSRVTFIDAQGNHLALGGHRNVSGDDGNPDDTLYQSIIANAEALAEPSKQKAVIMQSIGFASTRIFTELCRGLASNVRENEQFTHTVQQKTDGSVDVTITMPPSHTFSGSLTLTIDSEGNVKATAFDFGLASGPDSELASGLEARPRVALDRAFK